MAEHLPDPELVFGLVEVLLVLLPFDRDDLEGIILAVGVPPDV